MYTSTDTVYIKNFHSDTQNNVVKYKSTTHEAFIPALVLNEDIISDTHHSLAGGYFNNFLLMTKILIQNTNALIWPRRLSL